MVVRVGGAGVCATDLHAIDGLMEPAGLKPPVVLGHENAGWVHAVGDDVTAAAVGDAVLVYPPYSCGLCVACRRGLDMHCERHQFTGLTCDGGFADYVLVDERSLIPLPPGVEPAEVAPHSDAGLTAYHAVKKLVPRLAPDTTTAVIGVGGVGHIALQLLQVLGAGQGRRDRHRRAAPAARGGARRRRGLGEQGDAGGRGARGDERGGRGHRPRPRRHRRDARVQPADARARRRSTRSSGTAAPSRSRRSR